MDSANTDHFDTQGLVANDGGEGQGRAPRKVLMVFHREESQAGAVGQWLRRHGFQMDCRCPAIGDPLPETLENHAGAIMFGGPMSANDPDDYIRREIDWISVPLREDKPFFGICLGAQMLAKHLGAEVYEHPQAHVEVGYYPIQPADGAADDLALTALPERVYQWHREGFAMPSGAKKLAAGTDGAAFENQALQYGGKAIGVQFHPEMTLATIHRWTTHAAHRLTGPNARPRSEHITEHQIYGPALRAWLDQFMRGLFGAEAKARSEQK